MIGYAMLLLTISLGCLLAGLQGSSTDGMTCKTAGTFKYCEGKGSTYLMAENAIKPQSENTSLVNTLNSPEVEDRKHNNPEHNRPNHFPSFQRPRSCNRNECKHVDVNVSPTFLINVRDQERFILQLGAIQQRLPLAICTEPRCGRGQCEQQYSVVKLFAWDPNSNRPRLFTDQFRIPHCCRCIH